MAPRFVLEMFMESEILINITEHKVICCSYFAVFIDYRDLLQV